MDFDDMKELGNAYLAHHGVEGMKWGERNGPPYPLEGEGKKNFLQQVKENRKKKRRKKILKDPEKLAKYNEEFTLEEIAEAIKRFDAIAETKKRIPADKLKSGLNRNQKRMAGDPVKLLKNLDKFNDDDYKKAYDRLKKQRDLQDMAISDVERPAKILGIGNAYLGEIATGISKVKGGLSDVSNIHDSIVKITGSGPTYADKYSNWAKEHGYSGKGEQVTKEKVKEWLKEEGIIS